MDFTNIFNEAIALARTSPPSPFVEDNPTAVLCANVKIAQDKLFAELLQKLPLVVLDAAKQGRYTTDLLVFSGNEKYDADFSYLFLLKGPREREQKYDLFRCGFVPLFDTIMTNVTPFQLMFTWVPGCNLNKLTLEWSV